MAACKHRNGFISEWRDHGT